MSDNTHESAGFHHLAMKVWDFDATLSFYREALGFIPAYSWGADERAAGGTDSRAAFLDGGNGNYMEIFAGGSRPPTEEPPEGVLLHIALRAQDCDAALTRARTAGAKVTMETADIPVAGTPPTTVRIAFIKGPDNEIIEFFQNDLLR
ncbi:MAG TPA: VOC family protein [Armatimonadota bacterium]|jgi:glyoxylase I family protein